MRGIKIWEFFHKKRFWRRNDAKMTSIGNFSPFWLNIWKHVIYMALKFYITNLHFCEEHFNPKFKLLRQADQILAWFPFIYSMPKKGGKWPNWRHFCIIATSKSVLMKKITIFGILAQFPTIYCLMIISHITYFGLRIYIIFFIA